MRRASNPKDEKGEITPAIRAAFDEWQAALLLKPDMSLPPVERGGPKRAVEEAFVRFRDLVYEQPNLPLMGVIQQLEREQGAQTPLFLHGPKHDDA